MALQQARAGVGRAANVRANYFITNAVVRINGVDRSSAILQQGGMSTLGVTLALNDEPDTARFTLRSNAGFEPVEGQTIYISLGSHGNYEFGGQIERVRLRFERGVGNAANEAPDPYIEVDAVDWLRLFNRRLITREWRGESASTIAQDILADYTSGFTGGGIAADLATIDQFVCIDETPGAAFKRLANLVRGGYYIDAGRDVHLFGIAGETAARFGTAPQSLTSSARSLKTFAGDREISQIRTRVIVDAQETTCPIGTPGGDITTPTDATRDVDYLLVAGGGSGAGSRGGGGGAGGVLSGTATLAVGTFSVVIGAGGTAGGNGSNSTWNGLTAVGGGAGGTNAGSAGGSGGGGSNGSAGGAGTAGQGNTGGTGNFALSAAGGGGGGAAAAGGSASPNQGGNGGAGQSSAISGAVAYYGGGGGGNGDSGSGTGGVGGGGNGGAGGNPGTAGTANTGGGGGGGGTYAGGSGVAVFSYATGTLTATGGTITTSGGRTIHTFTSNGTFEITEVTTVADVPLVTDLPLEDASRIDANGGVVRIGPHVMDYLSTIGPVVAEGANPPGSTLSADAAVGATALSVADLTVFTESYGWVKVGDQIVRYSGTGGGQLTGLPASGFGSLTAAVKSSTQVTWLGGIRLSDTGVTFEPPLKTGEAVVQRVELEDTTAQALVAAVEGGDGIHEHKVSDNRLTVDGAITRAAQELGAFNGSLTTVTWDTEDLNARPGRVQTVNFGSFIDDLLITRVSLTFPQPYALPRRQCEASNVRTSEVLDAIVTTTK